MNPSEISKRLQAEFGYSPAGAAAVSGRLEQCSSIVLSAFEKWWTTGQVISLEVEGYTTEQLIEEYRMKPAAAYVTLDWLLKEPAAAKAALSRGHDHVGKREDQRSPKMGNL